MPNKVKYSTSTPSNALRKGNVAIGVNDVEYGPTGTTSWYNGKTPASGTYQIYKTAASGDPDIFTPTTDEELYNFVKMQGGSANDITSVGSALAWIATQANLFAVNNSLPDIVTEGLVFCVDASDIGSYPTVNSDWYDISGEGNDASLINTPPFNPYINPSFNFNGIDEYVEMNSISNTFTDALTVETWYQGTDSSGNNNLWNFTGTNNLNCSFNLSGNTLKIYWESGGTNAIEFTSPQFCDGNIHHLVFTHTGSTNQVYLDSVLQTPNATSGTQGFTGIQGNSYNLCANPFFTGNLFVNRVYNKGFSAAEVLQNYNSVGTRFDYTGTLADDYITARGITNTTHKNALKKLEERLFTYGLTNSDGSSSKITSLHLYGGTQATATGHKWNFMNPVDTDAAYRETYYGGLTHDANGITGNGINGYIDNHFTHADFPSQNSAHTVHYSRQDIYEGLNAFRALYGNVNSSFQGTALYPDYNGTTMYHAILSSSGGGVFSNTAQGLFLSTRTGVSVSKLYRDGVVYFNQNATSTSVTTTTSIMGLGRSYNSGATDSFSKQNLCARSFGAGLDDTESVDYSNALNEYFTTLGLNSYPVYTLTDNLAIAFANELATSESYNLTSREAQALDNFCKRIKGNDPAYSNYGNPEIYSKAVGRQICPMLGLSTDTKKYNLMDPSSTSLQQTYVGGCTANVDGITVDGVNGYVNSNVILDNLVGIDNQNVCVGNVLRDSSSRWDFGTYGISSPNRGGVWRRIGTGISSVGRSWSTDNVVGGGGNDDNQGHTLINLSGTPSAGQNYHNGVLESVNNTGFVSSDDAPWAVPFGAVSVNGTPTPTTTENTIMFQYIIGGLSSSSITVWNTIVDDFMNDLNKKTW